MNSEQANRCLITACKRENTRSAFLIQYKHRRTKSVSQTTPFCDFPIVVGAGGVRKIVSPQNTKPLPEQARVLCFAALIHFSNQIVSGCLPQTRGIRQRL
jgi:hypothetical protein